MDIGGPGSGGAVSGERQGEIVDADDDLAGAGGAHHGGVDRGADLRHGRPVPGNHVDLDLSRPDPDSLDAAPGQVRRDLTETTAGESGHVRDGEDRGRDEIRIHVGEVDRAGHGTDGRGSGGGGTVHWTRRSSSSCSESPSMWMSPTEMFTSVTSSPVIRSSDEITLRRTAPATSMIETP